MLVVKRDGRREAVDRTKIVARLRSLAEGARLDINVVALAAKVEEQLHDGMQTARLDELAAEQCAAQATEHPDYGEMAARLVVSNHEKQTPDAFSVVVTELAAAGVVSPAFARLVAEYGSEYDAMVCLPRDYCLTYFGMRTLLRSYLLRTKERVVERPQHMWLRVAIVVHGRNLRAVKQAYEMMSTLCYTHATPTLFNAGTHRQQMSSCYLLAMKDDSIEGIFSTLKTSAMISKHAGGQGIHVHNIRGRGAHIKGTNGSSNGLVPMLRVFNNAARYVDQGGGKRPGAIAIYLSPDHIDVREWLEMRKNHGNEDERARDLFYGMWISDLFMQRVRDGGKWTLMCPQACPGLADAVGDEYTALYERYEREIAGGDREGVEMKARDLWFKILDSQIETGTPYMLYKDACNSKSNQKNLGTIKSSNLCCEIVEYSSAEEIAVCNLASISLPAAVRKEDGREFFDHERLHAIACCVAESLDKVIDINYYPVPETEASNLNHRPIGIGVQGLADVFARLEMPFDSEEARALNREIFATIYHAAIETSCRLARERREVSFGWTQVGMGGGVPHRRLRDSPSLTVAEARLPSQWAGAYSSFPGSPASEGVLQFDLWNAEPSDRYDWAALKADVVAYGLRNSLSVAPMPTASTSQILGNNEAIEPVTSNIYARRTGAGEYVQVNKYLQRELIGMELWSSEMKDSILANNGSVQHLDLPQEMKERYRTAWELPMRSLIDMSADRAPYVCQSQSLNLWMESPTYAALTAMHLHAWSKGLKTGMYYLRTRARAAPQQFTVDPSTKGAATACSLRARAEGIDCEMCSA
jgi:ribonucleoside-diphosphate reductase alpha subunit